jgi:hypothetical protein
VAVNKIFTVCYTKSVHADAQKRGLQITQSRHSKKVTVQAMQTVLHEIIV